MPSDQTAPVLRAQQLFKHASDEVIALANRYVRYRKVVPGDIVVRYGDPDSPLVLVIAGQLQVSSVSEDGHETGLGRMKAGESLGESAIILDTPVLASCTASTKAVVGVISRVPARTLLFDPSVADALLVILSNKLHRSVRGQLTLSMPRAYSRVYAVINATLIETADETQLFIELPSQETIAMAANVSRETVSRAIKSLVQRGAIAKQGRRLWVRDRGKFAEHARGDGLR